MVPYICPHKISPSSSLDRSGAQFTAIQTISPSRRKKCSRTFRKWSQSIVDNTHFMVVVFYPEFLGGLTVFIIKHISAIYDIYILIYNPHFTPNHPHPLDLHKLMVQNPTFWTQFRPASPSHHFYGYVYHPQMICLWSLWHWVYHIWHSHRSKFADHGSWLHVSSAKLSLALERLTGQVAVNGKPPWLLGFPTSWTVIIHNISG